MPRAQPLETILQGIHQFIETLEKFVPQWEIPAKTEWDFPEWEKNLPQTAGDVMGYFRSWWFFTSKMSRAWHPGVKTRGLFHRPLGWMSRWKIGHFEGPNKTKKQKSSEVEIEVERQKVIYVICVVVSILLLNSVCEMCPCCASCT